MKNLSIAFVALFLLVSAQLIAQPSTPSKEFTVSLPESNITLKAGETKTVEVYVNRSLRFQKTKIDLALASALPAGVTVSFERATDPSKADKMVIAAASNIAPFKSTYVLNAKSSTITRGTTFTIASGADSSLPAGE